MPSIGPFYNNNKLLSPRKRPNPAPTSQPLTSFPSDTIYFPITCRLTVSNAKNVLISYTNILVYDILRRSLPDISNK
jgi:hypothetical protein